MSRILLYTVVDFFFWEWRLAEGCLSLYSIALAPMLEVLKSFPKYSVVDRKTGWHRKKWTRDTFWTPFRNLSSNKFIGGCVRVDIYVRLPPTDSTRASPATAVRTVETCAAASCETICWFSLTPPSRTPRTCRSTWSRAGGRSWKDSARCVAPRCAHCSATPPSLTATHQG